MKTNKPKKKGLRCGSKTRAGGKCQRFALRDKKRCRLHGGLAKTGPDANAFKHGRYSRFKGDFFQKVQEAREDPDLLSLKDEIHLIDAQMQARLNDFNPLNATHVDALSLLIGQRLALVQSERKRQVELATQMTHEQAATMVAIVVAAVKANIDDPNTIQSIITDLRRQLSGPVDRPTGNGGNPAKAIPA